MFITSDKKNYLKLNKFRGNFDKVQFCCKMVTEKCLYYMVSGHHTLHGVNKENKYITEKCLLSSCGTIFISHFSKSPHIIWCQQDCFTNDSEGEAGGACSDTKP
jgi:hypothetical protein